ncbi:MAG: zinc ribbon domain-containing protein [Anaerolineae bacterium]|jgi:putative FmdB family regulatory protein|nr:zinc ribbon domain-containing protein [Anaerolineae bacterium]
MPVYDYRCEECHTVFEQKRSMSDADKVAPCPACHSLLTTRLMSQVAVIGMRHSPEMLPSPAHRLGCACCSIKR